jgi:hypothetical protein
MVAHVDFNSLADAQEALARGPLRVRDQLLRLDFARQGRRGEVDTFFVRQQEALFVGNLFEATEGDLRALFDDASNGAPYELRLRACFQGHATSYHVDAGTQRSRKASAWRRVSSWRALRTPSAFCTHMRTRRS